MRNPKQTRQALRKIAKHDCKAKIARERIDCMTMPQLEELKCILKMKYFSKYSDVKIMRILHMRKTCYYKNLANALKLYEWNKDLESSRIAEFSKVD